MAPGDAFSIAAYSIPECRTLWSSVHWQNIALRYVFRDVQIYSIVVSHSWRDLVQVFEWVSERVCVFGYHELIIVIQSH